MLCATILIWVADLVLYPTNGRVGKIATQFFSVCMARGCRVKQFLILCANTRHWQRSKTYLRMRCVIRARRTCW
ncbi:hypothetical protein EB083_03545, partial [bacterium]|nr:hypothetical protein [bacterium]